MMVATEEQQQSVLKQLVVFHLAGETYGVDIYQVREIIRVPEITQVPRTPEFVEGVINLRGGVIPVLELRKRFGFEQSESSEDRRIVVIELKEQTVGMIVDGVSEVLGVNQAEIEPPSPYIVTIDTAYIGGVAKVDNRLIILLNLDRVLTADERESLTVLEGEQ